MIQMNIDEKKILEKIPQRPTYISKMGLFNQLRYRDFNFTHSQFELILSKFSDSCLITISPLLTLF